MIPISTEFYPFVLTSYRAQSNSEADYRDMFERTAEIARKSIRDRTFHVSISWGATILSAAERKVIGQLLDEYPKQYFDRVIGAYVIVPNALTRGVMTALRWIAPKLVSVESVASVDAAIRESDARLKKHAIPAERALVDGARAWLSREMRASQRPDRADAS